MDRLLEAVELVDVRGDASGAQVTALEYDSRKVTTGALFCCLPGRTHDGHRFAAAAVDAGAVGLLVEHPLALAVPQAVVAAGEARPSMARLAKAFYGDPASSMLTIGVTGTNGKTTVTHLLADVLEENAMPCRVIGTLQGPRTTPESPDLQRLLAEARDAGASAVAMEVSSHALTEARVDGIRFAAAVFTNLGHDHLDHHGTMDAYFAAKASLFTEERAALGVVNADDPFGRRLLEESRIELVAYCAADARDLVQGPRGSSFLWRGHRVTLPLLGTFHVLNAVAAATAAAAVGVPEEVVARGLSAARPVPGRFEVVGGPGPLRVVVDYAHTPDALRSALASARDLAGAGRVVCVFGCGGDRDRAKRPAMGQAAAEGADVVVVTSDNPRSEDPDAIIDAVLAGIADRDRVVVEPDRRRAIAKAVESAQPGDVVLVAGKGHEQVIESGDRRIPFDDRVEAAAALARRAREVTGP